MDKMNLQSSQEHSDRYMLEQLIDVQKKELQIMPITLSDPKRPFGNGAIFDY